MIQMYPYKLVTSALRASNFSSQYSVAFSRAESTSGNSMLVSCFVVVPATVEVAVVDVVVIVGVAGLVAADR